MEDVCQTCKKSNEMGQFNCANENDLLILCSGPKLPIFHPEFGRFMLEATPGKPWGIGFKDLLDVEPNMKLR